MLSSAAPPLRHVSSRPPLLRRPRLLAQRPQLFRPAELRLVRALPLSRSTLSAVRHSLRSHAKSSAGSSSPPLLLTERGLRLTRRFALASAVAPLRRQSSSPVGSLIASVVAPRRLQSPSSPVVDPQVPPRFRRPQRSRQPSPRLALNSAVAPHRLRQSSSPVVDLLASVLAPRRLQSTSPPVVALLPRQRLFSNAVAPRRLR